MANYLIDTNILLRNWQSNHSMHRLAADALSRLIEQEEHLVIVPQNISELWNVCTRPLENNGLGLTVEETITAIEELEQVFHLYLDIPELYFQWKELVVRYSVCGAKVHDAKLVAACLVHNLTHILTFNERDFLRYQEITVINPEKLT
jgi:predicted nucleic acid-binding protein